MEKNIEAAIAAIEKAADVLASARATATEIIQEIMSGRTQILFRPAGGLDPEDPQYRTSLEDNSFGVDYYEGLPGSERFGGFITAVRVDAASGRVMVDGIKMFLENDETLYPFSVPVEWVENPESVLRFIEAYEA